jgi:hypothetical protein
MPERAGCRKRRWTQQDMPEAVAGPIGPSMIPFNAAVPEGADAKKPLAPPGLRRPSPERRGDPSLLGEDVRLTIVPGTGNLPIGILSNAAQESGAWRSRESQTWASATSHGV